MSTPCLRCADAEKRAKSWKLACREEERRRKALEVRISQAVDLLEDSDDDEPWSAADTSGDEVFR